MRIYYFSGTGNSFYVAKMISMNFPDSKIESIAELKNTKDILMKDDNLLIICPIYFYGIPNIVKEFLERMRFDGVKYFTVIFTAEYPNGIVVDMLKQICKRKNLTLNSCFYLQMPTNYLIKSKMLELSEINKVIDKSESKINRIIEIIKMQKNHIEKDSKLYSLIVNGKNSYSKWEQMFPEFDSWFTVTDSCNRCKLCETHCPVGNININGKPVWNNNCESCLKCINICPKQAIQYDMKTEGRKRYFNPKVKIDEFK